ncbi:aldo/keto reductase [Blastococcus sp. SYSU DS0753]
MATLMREPARGRRRTMLSEAYDLGFRHFDVAPLYGLGAAESELGEFAAHRPDCIITTKVGLAPGRFGQVLSSVQRPLRWGLQRSPRLRQLVRARGGSGGTNVTLTPESVRSSVESSLKRLQVERLDYLLLHEHPAKEVADDVWDVVQRLISRGDIGSFGVSGSPAVINSSDVNSHPPIRVIQTSDWLRPEVKVVRPDVQWRHYGVIAPHMDTVTSLLGDRVRSDAIERVLDRALRTESDVVNVLVSLSVTARKNAMALIGTTRPDHLRSIASFVDGGLPDPAAAGRARALIAGAQD